jgi:hypothetical protein
MGQPVVPPTVQTRFSRDFKPIFSKTGNRAAATSYLISSLLALGFFISGRFRWSHTVAPLLCKRRMC